MKHMARYASLALVLGLTACAAGSDASHQAAQGGPASLIVLGFWHGLIAPVTLVVEIINALALSSIPWQPQFYEGGGVLYDLGFFVGLVAGPSILLRGTSRRRGV